MRALEIIFMGTPEFAIPSLEALLKSNHKVKLVITQPDRPKGRGQQLSSPPVKELANKEGLPLLQPTKIKEQNLIETIKNYKPDVIVVVAYGKIIPQTILDIPRFGCINLHPSLLPKYRGPSPISSAIINGDKVTGVTTMFMDAGMDTGDILLQEEEIILEDDTADTLSNRLSIKGANLIIKTLNLLSEGKLERKPQDNSIATYTSMLKKEDGLIKWEKTSKEIYDHIRGMTPWPSAYTFLKGKMVKLFQPSNILEENLNFKPGEVIEVKKDGIKIATGNGSIVIKELQYEGRKKMNVAEFLKGTKILPGDIFLNE